MVRVCLPFELVERLHAARDLERLARTVPQVRNSARATAALLLAGHRAGWPITDMAPHAGLTRAAAQARVIDARRRYGDQAPALDVPLHPRFAPHPLDVFAPPLDQREWLRREEAAALAGVTTGTIRVWQQYGILPHSQRLTGQTWAYLRADVLRVVRTRSETPTRHVAVDRRRVLAEISRRR